MRGLATLDIFEKMTGKSVSHVIEADGRAVADYIHWLFEEAGRLSNSPINKDWLIQISEYDRGIAENAVVESISSKGYRIDMKSVTAGLDIFLQESNDG